jgi:protein MpaA
MIRGRFWATGAAALALLATALVGPATAEVNASAAATQPGTTAARAVTETRVFGKSVKGRLLRAYRLGDPTSPRKVVLIASIHGDEPGPAKILLNLMHGAPITGADVWVIPYLNRDGLARHTRKNARGVDLNRNYPVKWTRQRGKYNSGRRAASEPETRSLMRFLTNVRPTFIVSMHQPLKGVDTSDGKARPLALRLIKGLHLRPSVFNCNSGCHGTMTEWFNAQFPGAAITVEYGAKVSKYQANVTGPNGLLAAVFASRGPAQLPSKVAFDFDKNASTARR